MTGYPYKAIIDGKEYILSRIPKYKTMPTPSADYLNQTVQYTGALTTSPPIYFNSLYYKCTATTDEGVTTYAWTETVLEVHDTEFYCRINEDRTRNESNVEGIRLEKGAISLETIMPIPELHINDIVYFRGYKYRVVSTRQIPLNTLDVYNTKMRTYINLQ